MNDVRLLSRNDRCHGCGCSGIDVADLNVLNTTLLGSPVGLHNEVQDF